MTMTQPLFFNTANFVEKTAGEVDLPDDPNQWAQQILQELYKQVPYITDYQPHVQMSRVDAERGYGMGHVEIQNQSEAPMETPQDQLDAAGIRTVRIPFVIREKKLSPFDLLISDTGATVPLTENRLRQSLFRPQAFDVTSRTPGDQSMIGQLYPPYRQNYGFGGGGISMNAAGGMGIGKVGSALEEFLTPKTAAELTQASRERIKPKSFAIPKGDGPGGTGKYPIHDERHAKNALTRVAQHGTSSEKSKVYSAVAKKYPGVAAESSVPALAKKASILVAILPTLDEVDSDRLAEEVTKNASALYSMANGSSRFSAAVDALLSCKDQVKHASWEAWVRPDVVQVQKTAGGYRVKTASYRYWEPKADLVDRGDVVRAYGTDVALEADLTGSCTIPRGLMKTAKEESALPQPITKPGAYKVMDSSGKEHIGFVTPSLVNITGEDIPLALFTNGSAYAVQSDMQGVPAGDIALPAGPIGRTGAFYTLDGNFRMTVPMTLEDSVSYGDQPRAYHGSTIAGEPVIVSVQANIADVTPVDAGKVLVPASWKWLPLDGAESISVIGGEQAAAANPEEKLSSVRIISDGSSFSFSGVPLTKMGSAEKNFLDLDASLFLLAGLGVDLNYGSQKLAEAVAFHRPVELSVARVIERREDLMRSALEKAAGVVDAVATFKQPILLKEAASFPDPQMVDTVLSLGFINPENIMTFVSYLPDIEDVQTKLCEVLFAVRLGLSNVPQSSLERAIRSTEEVIEGLKVLGFQGS